MNGCSVYQQLGHQSILGESIFLICVRVLFSIWGQLIGYCKTFNLLFNSSFYFYAMRYREETNTIDLRSAIRLPRIRFLVGQHNDAIPLIDVPLFHSMQHVVMRQFLMLLTEDVSLQAARTVKRPSLYIQIHKTSSFPIKGIDCCSQASSARNGLLWQK